MSASSEVHSVVRVEPGKQTEDMFKRFGLELRHETDFRLISEFRDRLHQTCPVGLSEEEQRLVLSGQHPAVALYMLKETGEPQLRLTQAVAKGAILGQLATRVIPAALAQCVLDPLDDEMLDAYRRNCFAVVAEFDTDVPPDELDESTASVVPRRKSSLDMREYWAFRNGEEKGVCEAVACSHTGGDGRFADPMQLAEHLEHVCDLVELTADKRYICPWANCIDVLSSKQNLRQHVKNIHGALMRECPKCKVQFKIYEQKQARVHVNECGLKPSSPENGNSSNNSSSGSSSNSSNTNSVVNGSSGKFGSMGGSWRAREKRPVKLRFEAGDACNIFGLGRCGELQNLTQNCHLITALINGLPYLCVEAMADLPAGTELIFDWGDENLTYIMRFSLFAMASHSHSCHIYRRKLESLYNIYNLPRPLLGRLKSVSEETDVLWQRFVRQHSLSLRDYKRAYYELLKMDSTFRDEALPYVSRESAFEHSECTLLPRTKASPEARRQLITMSAAQRPPRWQDEFSDKIRQTEALLWSNEVSNVEIRRMDFLFHPVRFLNPPGRNQYGVFARVSVAAHAPILCYKGEIITQQEHDAMSPLPQYAFDFTIDLSLHINADDNGNEGRFVNDCFGRVWECGHADSEAANARYHICWDDTNQIPVLFVVAKDRHISQGEEIVVDYGSHFWNPLMHELGRRHAKFYCRTRQINEQLAADLRAKGISVPPQKHWPELLNDKDTFVYRNLPPGATPDWELEDENESVNAEIGVEMIVDKRVMPFGVQYLVKWESFDWSHNTWTHAKDAPPEMVSAFEARLAGLRDGTPQTRRKAKANIGSNGSRKT